MRIVKNILDFAVWFLLRLGVGLVTIVGAGATGLLENGGDMFLLILGAVNIIVPAYLAWKITRHRWHPRPLRG